MSGFNKKVDKIIHEDFQSLVGQKLADKQSFE